MRNRDGDVECCNSEQQNEVLYCAFKINLQRHNSRSNIFTEIASISSYFNQILREIVDITPWNDVCVAQHCRSILRAQYYTVLYCLIREKIKTSGEKSQNMV